MFFNFNKVFYYVLTHRQYIIINTLVLAACFVFYQPFSGLFTIWRYIQCAHTILDPIVFTLNHNSYKILKF